MFIHRTKTRQAQIRLPLDDFLLPSVEIWEDLPGERQWAAMSMLARLVARLRLPERVPDQNREDPRIDREEIPDEQD